jgi:hypothetical protein
MLTEIEKKHRIQTKIRADAPSTVTLNTSNSMGVERSGERGFGRIVGNPEVIRTLPQEHQTFHRRVEPLKFPVLLSSAPFILVLCQKPLHFYYTW